MDGVIRIALLLATLCFLSPVFAESTLGLDNKDEQQDAVTSTIPKPQLNLLQTLLQIFGEVGNLQEPKTNAILQPTSFSILFGLIFKAVTFIPRTFLKLVLLVPRIVWHTIKVKITIASIVIKAAFNIFKIIVAYPFAIFSLIFGVLS